MGTATRGFPAVSPKQSFTTEQGSQRGCSKNGIVSLVYVTRNISKGGALTVNTFFTIEEGNSERRFSTKMVSVMGVMFHTIAMEPEKWRSALIKRANVMA